jgi:hypothetical protein
MPEAPLAGQGIDGRRPPAHSPRTFNPERTGPQEAAMKTTDLAALSAPVAGAAARC